MMTEKILSIIYEAIEEVNTQLPEGQFLKKDPETPLHGEDSNIDSLGLIIFMVNLEQKLTINLGKTVSLTNNPNLLSDEKALQSINSLSEFIQHSVLE